LLTKYLFFIGDLILFQLTDKLVMLIVILGYLFPVILQQLS
jgi:hypothetical protein